MNEEDIATVEALAEFMCAEAALWGRTESTQKFTNGKGIREQWHERINFPYAMFYTVGKEGEPHPDGAKRIVHEMKSMWFDINGDKTERPLRNTDTLFHND